MRFSFEFTQIPMCLRIVSADLLQIAADLVGARQFEDDLEEVVVDAVLNRIAGGLQAFRDLREGWSRLTGLAVLTDFVDDDLVGVLRFAEHVQKYQKHTTEGGHCDAVEDANEQRLRTDRGLRLNVEERGQQRHVLQ